MSYPKGHSPWNKNLKGIHLSPKSEFKKGSSGFIGHHSEETKRKLSLANKGKKPWNASIPKVKKDCLQCNSEFLIWSARIRQGKGKYCSKECKIKSFEGFIPWNKGKEGFLKGNKHYNWQGGKTSKQLQIIHSFKYRQFRVKIFERDNYSCIMCGDSKGHNLQVDHILPQSLFPELRYEMNNCRTLCDKCHKKTPTYLNSKMRKGDFINVVS